VYEWYNGLQRDRNKYAPLLPATKQLLDALFCDHNQDLAHLLNDNLGLKGGGSRGGWFRGERVSPPAQARIRLRGVRRKRERGG